MAAKKKTMMKKTTSAKKVVIKRKKSSTVAKGKKKISPNKKASKKSVQFSDLDKTVLCCVYCDSPSVHKAVLNSKEQYYCLRCGKHHLHVNEKPLYECKELLKDRKLLAKMQHNIIKDAREKKFYLFIDNFYLRMGFRLVSLLLIIGGFIFTFSNFWTGMLFIVIGLVSLSTAESL